MDPLAEKYYSISPYAYCANNPVKYTDPTGKWLESAWDAFSLATGIESLVSNVRKGNVVDAIVDVGGIALDAVAIVLPVVPGGAGVAIKGARAAEKAVDIARVADKTAEGTKVVEKVSSSSKGSRFVGDIDGKLIDTKATPKGSYTHPDGSRTDVLQDKTHFDKNSKTNHGTTHTHEPPISNTLPDGSIQKKSSNRTHIPTYEEIERIKNGTAIKTK